MSYRSGLLRFANAATRRTLRNRDSLPTFYLGRWLKLSPTQWSTLYSQYEPETGAAIKHTLRPGDSFWDVGAHFGWFSLFAAALVGSHGRVLSFEPAPEVFSALEQNTCHLRNIRRLNVGIGNFVGDATFFAQGRSSAGAFVSEVTAINSQYHPDDEISPTKTSIVTLDSLITTNGAPRLIKIDVEGYELAVLQGANTVLTEHHPDLIIEIHPKQLRLSGGSEDELFSCLERHSYRYKTIHRNINTIHTIHATAAR